MPNVYYFERQATTQRMRSGKVVTIAGAGGTGGGGSILTTGTGSGGGSTDLLATENTWAENQYFAKNIFTKTGIYVGDYTTSSYASLTYTAAGDILTVSAAKFTISDYVLERSAAGTLKANGILNVTGALTAGGILTASGAANITGVLTAASNASIGGTLAVTGIATFATYPYLNSGARFGNAGAYVSVGYDPTNTRLNISGNAYISGDATTAGNMVISGTHKLVFNQSDDSANYYLQYADAAYGIKGNSAYGWSFLSAGTMALRIDTAGNIGIKTTPAYPLDILTATADAINIKRSTAASGVAIRFENGDYNYGRIWFDSSNAMRFDIGSTDSANMKMYLNSTGLGIGTTPTYFTHIKKDQNAATICTLENATSGTSAYTTMQLVGASGAASLNVYSAAYTAVANRSNRTELNSTSTDGFQLINANYLRFANTRGTDIMRITGGSIYTLGALYTADSMGIEGASDGFTGTGWHIDTAGNLHVKSIEVRETLTAYSMQVQKMDVSEGSKIFTEGVEVVGTDTNAFYYDASHRTYAVFAAGAILRCEQFGSGVKYYQIQVVSDVAGTEQWASARKVTYTNKSGSSAVAIGDTIARVSGTVLEISSNNGGYMQIASGITTTAQSWTTNYKIGYINGSASTAKGSNAIGYGIWSDKFVLDNDGAYLAGVINAYSGKIGKNHFWEFDGDGNLWSGYQLGESAGMQLSAQQKYIGVYTDEENIIKMYQTSTTDWGIKGTKANETIFQLGSSNQIADFIIEKSQLYQQNLTTKAGIAMYSDTSTIRSYMNLAVGINPSDGRSADAYVELGKDAETNLPSINVYGIDGGIVAQLGISTNNAGDYKVPKFILKNLPSTANTGSYQVYKYTTGGKTFLCLQE